MQHVGLQRETEFGDILERFEDSGIDLRVVQRAPANSAVLRFIDPYGNTLINQLQLVQLIAELREFVSQAVEQDFCHNVERLVRFLEASKGVHVYVRFVGD